MCIRDSIISQLVTLYITPIVYLYMERLQKWVGKTRVASPLPAPATSC